ncbi:MAG TPA: YidB family protein [Acidobacteriaceae bacterium]|nr:YidB family protein [Acidobacteriaceae bacterium]
MGLLDSLESMAANSMTSSGDNTTKVAGGMMEALEQHPGGLGAILQNFRNNGLGGHVDAIQNGQTPSVTPEQVQTGLQGTGLLDTIASKAGVSPQVAQAAMATVLPMVMAHFAQNGSAPSSNILSGMLSKLGGSNL